MLSSRVSYFSSFWTNSKDDVREVTIRDAIGCRTLARNVWIVEKMFMWKGRRILIRFSCLCSFGSARSSWKCWQELSSRYFKSSFLYGLCLMLFLMIVRSWLRMIIHADSFSVIVSEGMTWNKSPNRCISSWILEL